MSPSREDALVEFRALVRACRHEAVSAAMEKRVVADTGLRIGILGEHLGLDFGYDVEFLKKVMHEECDAADAERRGK